MAGGSVLTVASLVRGILLALPFRSSDLVLVPVRKLGSTGLLLSPSLEEFASRAMRMFSCDRMLSSIGESVSALLDAECICLVFSGAGCPCCSEELAAAIALRLGCPLTIGEYCDIGDEPLKAPVGVGGFRCAGGGARLPWLMFVLRGFGACLGGLRAPGLVSGFTGRGGRRG